MIKRYTETFTGRVLDKTGDYVLYTDHVAALEAEKATDRTPVSNVRGINTDLLEALKYVRRFLNPEDHDVSYVDDVIDNAEGRGLYAATKEGE
jgi:hypothetical protein